MQIWILLAHLHEPRIICSVNILSFSYAISREEKIKGKGNGNPPKQWKRTLALLLPTSKRPGKQTTVLRAIRRGEMDWNPKSLLHSRSQASLPHHGRVLLSAPVSDWSAPSPFWSMGKCLQFSQPPNQSYLCKGQAVQMLMHHWNTFPQQLLSVWPPAPRNFPLL